jgi:spore maturation protein CgeB
MRIVIFCHSIIADWNNGNAHFLRGVATELVSLGHQVDIFEPHNSWSMVNLIRDYGLHACRLFFEAYPQLSTNRYDPKSIDLEKEVNKADLVLIHEWNESELIRDIGFIRRKSDFLAFFHDTHHRRASNPAAFAVSDIEGYDGILVFGRALAKLYKKQGFRNRLFVWNEAADTRVFKPSIRTTFKQDLVWIGNWGDEERTAELNEYLIQPVKALGISGAVYGVRYPKDALAKLKDAGISFVGWTPNFYVPRIFSESRLTLHIPRAFYHETLPGIPTIRVFEALACGIPLISAPWNDSEQLFLPGDFITVKNGSEVESAVVKILQNPTDAARMAERGLRRILAHHTCAHRAMELIDIFQRVRTKDWSLAYSS